MNAHQFKELVCNKYAVDSNSNYWAPESVLIKFCETPQYNKDDNYQVALLVLCRNETAFKNRLLGIIKDDWLSAKTFGPICSYLIMALEDVVKLGEQYPTHDKYKVMEWQFELLAILRTF